MEDMNYKLSEEQLLEIISKEGIIPIKSIFRPKENDGKIYPIIDESLELEEKIAAFLTLLKVHNKNILYYYYREYEIDDYLINEDFLEKVVKNDREITQKMIVEIQPQIDRHNELLEEVDENQFGYIEFMFLQDGVKIYYSIGNNEFLDAANTLYTFISFIDKEKIEEYQNEESQNILIQRNKLIEYLKNNQAYMNLKNNSLRQNFIEQEIVKIPDLWDAFLSYKRPRSEIVSIISHEIKQIK